MSRLDAVVTSINVLNPMENQCCGVFKCMLCFKYTVYVKFANSDKIPHDIVFAGTQSHVLAASYSTQYFDFVVKTAEN